jgi:glycine betaine catabolism B
MLKLILSSANLLSSLLININGKSVQHCYSISSTPSRPHTLEITVKRFPSPKNDPSNLSSLVSNWLHNNLQVSDQIEISAPVGKFTNFAHPSPKLLLISAGSGIAPMMSMSRWICDTASNVDLVFLHSARSPEEIIFRQELEMMTSRYPNFKLAVTVTRPKVGQPWYGYTGRINEMILPAIAPDYQDRTVYVCGSNSFMEATKKLLQKLSFPMENFYQESYNQTQQKTQSAPSKPLADHTSIFPTTPPASSAHPSRTTSPADHTSIFPPASSAPYPPSETVQTAPPTFVVDRSAPSVRSTSSIPVTHVVMRDKSGRNVPSDREKKVSDATDAEDVK